MPGEGAGVRMGTRMGEQSNELKKLTDIANDLGLPTDLRTKALKQLGNIGTQEALLALLGIAANENLDPKERDLALKQARTIIKLIKTGRR